MRVASIHHLNKCWRVVDRIICNKVQINLIGNSTDIYSGKCICKTVCKMAAMLLRRQHFEMLPFTFPVDIYEYTLAYLAALIYFALSSRLTYPCLYIFYYRVVMLTTIHLYPMVIIQVIKKYDNVFFSHGQQMLHYVFSYMTHLLWFGDWMFMSNKAPKRWRGFAENHENWCSDMETVFVMCDATC